MPTALENLKAAYITRAAAITDDLAGLECLALIDEWYDCRLASAKLDAGTMQQYSLMGRQVTKRENAPAATRAAQLERQINDLLYGRGVLLADMGGIPPLERMGA
jgi:hypothetical protein